jgi:hypothetical protein
MIVAKGPARSLTEHIEIRLYAVALFLAFCLAGHGRRKLGNHRQDLRAYIMEQ